MCFSNACGGKIYILTKTAFKFDAILRFVIRFRSQFITFLEEKGEEWSKCSGNFENRMDLDGWKVGKWVKFALKEHYENGEKTMKSEKTINKKQFNMFYAIFLNFGGFCVK